MIYSVVLHSDGDGYGVTVPDLPGCYSAGSSAVLALGNAAKAIDSHVETLVQERMSVPEPQPLETHQANPDYADGIWALVEVDTERYLDKAERFNATLPGSLLRAVDGLVSRGQFASRSALLAEGARRILREQG